MWTTCWPRQPPLPIFYNSLHALPASHPFVSLELGREGNVRPLWTLMRGRKSLASCNQICGGGGVVIYSGRAGMGLFLLEREGMLGSRSDFMFFSDQILPRLGQFGLIGLEVMWKKEIAKHIRSNCLKSFKSIFIWWNTKKFRQIIKY